MSSLYAAQPHLAPSPQGRLPPTLNAPPLRRGTCPKKCPLKPGSQRARLRGSYRLPHAGRGRASGWCQTSALVRPSASAHVAVAPRAEHSPPTGPSGVVEYLLESTAENGVWYGLGELDAAVESLGTWHSALARGVLPQLRSEGAGGAGCGRLEVSWPAEPAFGAVAGTLRHLGLPHLTRRHPALAASVLRFLVDAALAAAAAAARRPEPAAAPHLDHAPADEAHDHEVREEGGLRDEDEDERADEGREDEDEEGEATAAAAAAAAAEARAFRARWEGPLGGLVHLDELFGPSHGLVPSEDEEGLGGGLGVGVTDGLWQHTGWQAITEVQRQLAEHPQLQRLVQELGRCTREGGPPRPTPPLREAPPRRAPPGVVRSPLQPTEVASLTRSAALGRLLPAELALLALSRSYANTPNNSDDGGDGDSDGDKEGDRGVGGRRACLAVGARRLFASRMAAGQLGTYEMSGWGDGHARVRAGARRQLPSGPGGPLVVCLDTSWSMEGARENLAKAVVLQAARAAHRQQRRCLVYMFAAGREVRELELPCTPSGVARLLHFLEGSFKGGTDVTAALQAAMDRMEGVHATPPPARKRKRRKSQQPPPREDADERAQASAAVPSPSAEWAFADVLLVSDGELPMPPLAPEAMQRLQGLRAREALQLHGLLIGRETSPPLALLCDRLHAFFSTWDPQAAQLAHSVAQRGPSRASNHSVAQRGPSRASDHSVAQRGPSRASDHSVAQRGARGEARKGSGGDAGARGRGAALGALGARGLRGVEGAGAGGPPRRRGRTRARWVACRARPRSALLYDDEDDELDDDLLDTPYAGMQAGGGPGSQRHGVGDGADEEARRLVQQAVTEAAQQAAICQERANARVLPAAEGGGSTAQPAEPPSTAELPVLSPEEAVQTDRSLPPGMVQGLVAAVEEGLVERAVEARLVVLAALCGEHLLLLGPPGTGKSQLARRLHSAVCGPTTPFFERLLTRFTTPEELFGPLSLAALEEDRYERQVEGYLPTATVAFLDEVFKANSSVLNALLGVLNERTFHNGTLRLGLPLQALVAASNELPETEDLEALYDRFLFRCQVHPVSDDGVLRLLESPPRSAAAPEEGGSTGQCWAAVGEGWMPEWREAATDGGVEVPRRVLELMRDLRRFLREEAPPPDPTSPAAQGVGGAAPEGTGGRFVSDRRLVKARNVLCVSAAAHGRAVVTLPDCLLLQHLLWHWPQDREVIRRWVVDHAAEGAGRGADRLRFVLEGLGQRALQALPTKRAPRECAAVLNEVAAVEAAALEQLQDAADDVASLSCADTQYWLEEDEVLLLRQVALPAAVQTTALLQALLLQAYSLRAALTSDVAPPPGGNAPAFTQNKALLSRAQLVKAVLEESADAAEDVEGGRGQKGSTKGQRGKRGAGVKEGAEGLRLSARKMNLTLPEAKAQLSSADFKLWKKAQRQRKK